MLSSIASSRFMILLLGLPLSIAAPKDAFALVWRTPSIIMSQPPSSYSPDLSVDPAGNAFMIWVSAENNQVQVAHFSSTTGTYDVPVIIYEGGPPSIGISRSLIATDATETAIALWHDRDYITNLYAAYYNGTAWQPFVELSTLPRTNSCAYASASMDGLGNGLAVWFDASGVPPPGNILASFFDRSTQTWEPTQILTPGDRGGDSPSSYCSIDGTAVAIWRDPTGNVVASNYKERRWTAFPGNLSASPAAFGTLSVRMDSVGNALALWLDEETSELLSSVYSEGRWSAPCSVSLGGGIGEYDFAMSNGGTAVVVWSDGRRAQYSLYTKGVWGAPATYSDSIGVNVKAAINSEGSMLLFARDIDGNIFSYTIPKGGTLPLKDFVGISDNVGMCTCKYANNERGFLSGIVRTEDGSFVTSTYSILDPSPPTD